MPDSLVKRLQLFEPLSEADVHALTALPMRLKAYGKRSDILREGDALDAIYLIRNGWACRYTILSDGRRQIISFVIPGDLCNAHVMLFEKMEHSIGALTPCEVGLIQPPDFLNLLESHPRISRALFWSGLVMEAILRERIVTLGRRTATQRVAHLFCELFLRLKAAGLARDDGYDLPLTQLDIADTLGLNHIHINRIVTTMRKLGLIELKGHVLKIRDWDRLTDLGEFDPKHLDGFINNGRPHDTSHVAQP